MTGGNILDVIKGRIAGVSVVGKQVNIRGFSSFYGNNQPLYLVDGLPVSDVETVTSIPLETIERVEVLKGPKAAIYGVRGGNGVIAIYTKHGRFMTRGVLEFDMLGYNTPRKFYEPKYVTNQEPQNNYTQVWVPTIVTNARGFAKVVFTKPGIQGNYKFCIQGISYSGHVGFTESVISNQ